MMTANATRIIIESRSISTVRSEKRNHDGGAGHISYDFIFIYLIYDELLYE